MSKHLKDPWVWLYGIGAAFIGGGASSVVAAGAAIGIAPDKFDLHSNLGNTLKMVGAVFIISGMFQTFYYLRQSPLPPLVEEETKP